MSKNYYIHLMDGKPAYFDKKDAVIYFVPSLDRHKLSHSDMICNSLAELREQQIKSQETLNSRGNGNVRNWDMEYLRIPSEES